MKKIKRIDSSVLNLIDEELMLYIIDDTVELIQSFQKAILQKRYEAFDKFDDFIVRLENVVELASLYVNNPKKTIPCYVAELLIELTELLVDMRKCGHFAEENGNDPYSCGEPEVIEQLSSFILSTASGGLFIRDCYFTAKDVEEYKNKLENEKNAHAEGAKKEKEASAARAADKKAGVEEWIKQNLNTAFDFSVLTEREKDILKAALKTDLKALSISWIQRRFPMGYPMAQRTIDRLEELGAISTAEQSEKVGLRGSERIVKVIII